MHSDLFEVPTSLTLGGCPVAHTELLWLPITPFMANFRLPTIRPELSRFAQPHSTAPLATYRLMATDRGIPAQARNVAEDSDRTRMQDAALGKSAIMLARMMLHSGE